MQDKRKVQIETKEFIPTYSKKGSAGMDLRAYLPNNKKEPLKVYAHEIKLIHTGVKMDIPQGHTLLITPRSGLALHNGITMTNSPGVIDSGYKDDIGIILHNTSDAPFYIKHGDRIAQAVLMPFTEASFDVVEQLSQDNNRGGGFGSSGVK